MTQRSTTTTDRESRASAEAATVDDDDAASCENEIDNTFPSTIANRNVEEAKEKIAVINHKRVHEKREKHMRVQSSKCERKMVSSYLDQENQLADVSTLRVDQLLSSVKGFVRHSFGQRFVTVRTGQAEFDRRQLEVVVVVVVVLAAAFLRIH
ncbi:hypothetical protein T06_14725 [Trichinella sp. T6]|nr:hypothetical protein T06_14725 [Trichinella sp. T6]